MIVVASPCWAPLTIRTWSASTASPRCRRCRATVARSLRAAAMGLVAQQGLEVAGCGQVPQGVAQQVGLTGEGGIVEAEVDGVRGHRLLVDAVAGRQG